MTEGRNEREEIAHLELLEHLVAALALGREVDVGRVIGEDVAAGVGHDRGVDAVADLALLEGCRFSCQPTLLATHTTVMLRFPKQHLVFVGGHVLPVISPVVVARAAAAMVTT